MHFHAGSHHDHDSDHEQGPNAGDPHSHRNPSGKEEPFDAANQSLSDALRASFQILKGIMLILVVVYLFSNVRTIGGHEQAVVLRLGRLIDRVHEAGLVWALPFPIDEIHTLPTRKINELRVRSHSFERREGEEGQPLGSILRGEHEGLDPALDGALLTADSGLVHAEWKIAYKIDDVLAFIRTYEGGRIEAAETLLQVMVATLGIQVASEMTADEVIRTRVDEAQSELRRRLNERLAAMGSGITVSMVEVIEPTPPITVRPTFDETQRAENSRQRRIREAQQEQTKILSDAAGAAHSKLVVLLQEFDAAQAKGEPTAELVARIDVMLDSQVEGRAGKMIEDSGSYHSVIVGQMQSDLKEYRALLPEYERNPHMLIGRKWEETRQNIFESTGVTKLYRPTGLRELRIKIPLDPEESRQQEEQRLQQAEPDPSKLLPDLLHSFGPDDGG